MPMGSTFSIEQTMMQLSAQSRTTSISYSFQPRTDCSMSTSRVGEARRPPFTISRSEEHTSELQSLMRISYAVFCLKKKTTKQERKINHTNKQRNRDTDKIHKKQTTTTHTAK